MPRRAPPGGFVHEINLDPHCRNRERLRAVRTPMLRSTDRLEILAGAIRNAYLRKRSALTMTDTELRLMANAAIIGDSSQPVKG